MESNHCGQELAGLWVLCVPYSCTPLEAEAGCSHAGRDRAVALRLVRPQMASQVGLIGRVRGRELQHGVQRQARLWMTSLI